MLLQPISNMQLYCNYAQADKVAPMQLDLGRASHSVVVWACRQVALGSFNLAPLRASHCQHAGTFKGNHPVHGTLHTVGITGSGKGSLNDQGFSEAHCRALLRDIMLKMHMQIPKKRQEYVLC